MISIFNRFQSPVLVAAAILISTSVAAFGQSTSATTAGQGPAAAQSPAPDKQRRPTRRPATTPAKVVVIAGQSQVAPQVVTIVHRLTGVQMLRYLLRQGSQGEKIFTIDPEAISKDAHASIVAGWAMDDGKTIAARLPQAGAEIEFGLFSWSPPFEGQLPSAIARQPFAQSRAESDLTVITNDGRRLRARYVGLDGQTGLSVLQVNGVAAPTAPVASAKPLTEGENVQVFAPERTPAEAEMSSRMIYVKIVKTEAKISNLTRASTGDMQKLTVETPKLSPVILGGIACDQSGSTLGIVDALDSKGARIIPAVTIRAATRRVLERQASVPKPLLGVRGEPVDLAARATFLANGWREDQLNDLVNKQLGILLTMVMPGTPAALANLRPGDVIVGVNKEEVKNAEQFSNLLSEAGSGAQVQFAVRRPGDAATLPFEIKLGGSFEPVFEWHFEMPPIQPAGLKELGIETATLSPESVSPLGAQTGVLVVAVQPESVAARSGIREGDVIESIDGHSVRNGTWVFTFKQKKHVFSIIRKREKKQIVVETVE